MLDSVAMDARSLLAGRSRETTIRRDAEGRWYHDGAPLEHPGLCRSFDAWVERAEDGRYCLKNDINWAYCEIEGPAFFVRTVHVEQGGTVRLSLSGDLLETLDPQSLRQDTHGVLYCDVRGGLPARFDRHAAAGLEHHIEADAEGVYLQLGASKVRPPLVDDPLQPHSHREQQP
ncbi:MAG: DUF1285 domain-containing protein [Myxococcales bacterium]|nr:DUF1285 domain-containing protein [Myxococcales bacterium]